MGCNKFYFVTERAAQRNDAIKLYYRLLLKLLK